MYAPKAVVEIGSTGIRLLIAETQPQNFNSQNSFSILDKSDQPVNIGRDVFTTGYISRETLLSCIQILNRYAEQLETWGIPVSEAYVVATTAVREAVNRDPFVDRIKIKTGFTIRVIDGIEENRLMYIAVSECLKKDKFADPHKNSLIIEISGGASELMILEDGQMVTAHSIRLGTVIVEQKIKSVMGSINDAHRFVSEYIRNTKINLKTEIELSKIKQFIAIGNDVELAAINIGTQVSENIRQINRADFEQFIEEIKNYTPEETVARFKMNYNDACTFPISLLTYKLFIDLTDAETIVVPETSIREGLILTLTNTEKDNLQDGFEKQILAGAMTLLRKYNGDEEHAKCVSEISLKLFDAMQNELGLDRKSRLLLSVCAILHDIGIYISPTNHNLHGRYIVSNSEIFGLTREEKNIVALIISFHRGKKMPYEDEEVKLLSRSARMKILKLTALLRIADAMDRSHQQRTKNFSLSFAPDAVTIRVKGQHNLNLEKLAISQKSDLFENLFGYKVVLV